MNYWKKRTPADRRKAILSAFERRAGVVPDGAAQFLAYLDTTIAAGAEEKVAQVEPKWLFADTDYALRGTRPSMLGKVMQILHSIPSGKRRPNLVIVCRSH